MKRFVEGIDRGQATLFPECLEDWLDQDNPVRVIDAFVEKLDLSRLGFDGLLIFGSRDDGDGEAKLIASDPERASDVIVLRPLWRIPAFDFGQGGGFHRLYY